MAETTGEIVNLYPERLPHNIEAEQALLGAILVNNEVFWSVADVVDEAGFYYPVHGRIYYAIRSLIQRGQIATPVTLKDYFEDDSELNQIGGPVYIARLAGSATATLNARDYAEAIHSLACRRATISAANQIHAIAAEGDVSLSASELMERAEQVLFELSAWSSGRSGGLTQISEYRGIYEHAGDIARGVKCPGVLTGINALDVALGALEPGDVLIAGGATGMGKSGFLQSIADNMAARGLPFGIISPEMSRRAIALRSMARYTGIDSARIRTGRLSEREWSAIAVAIPILERLPIYVDEAPRPTLEQVKSRARRMYHSHGLAALGIDYMQKIRMGDGRRFSRTEEIEEVSGGIRELAKELQIPVIALSQLNRDYNKREDNRPKLTDLHGASAIEKDADHVILLHREEYYMQDDEPADASSTEWGVWKSELDKVQGKAEIIIAKRREGSKGIVRIQFEAKTTRFYDPNQEKAHDQEALTF